MKYCKKCNKYYSEDKHYCSECGNVLLDKDKTKEKFEGIKSFIEDLEIFGFEILLERFIFPIVIVISIAELIFYWLELVIGIPKIMEDSWSRFILLAVIVAGLGHVREWLIKDYAGNPEMKTFGISRATFGDLEKALSWVYPVVEILCIFLWLRYAEDVLQLLVHGVDWDNLWQQLFSWDWEGLSKSLDFELFIEVLTDLLKITYKIKEWMLLIRGTELLWNIATVHREYDKEITIWSNVKGQIRKIFG